MRYTYGFYTIVEKTNIKSDSDNLKFIERKLKIKKIHYENIRNINSSLFVAFQLINNKKIALFVIRNGFTFHIINELHEYTEYFPEIKLFENIKKLDDLYSLGVILHSKEIEYSKKFRRLCQEFINRKNFIRKMPKGSIITLIDKFKNKTILNGINCKLLVMENTTTKKIVYFLNFLFELERQFGYIYIIVTTHNREFII